MRWVCCTIACLASCAPARVQNPVGVSRIFADSSAVELELTIQGEESVLNGARVRAVRVGKFSAEVCRYPKLSLELLESSPELGEAGARIFLLSHCNDPEVAAGVLPGPEVIEGERVVRAIVEAIGLPSTRSRPVWVTYRGAIEGARRPALLVEDLAELAARELGDRGAVDIPGGAIVTGSTRELDPAALARFHLLEIAINNGDWRVHELRPLVRRLRNLESSALHNVAVLRPKSGRGIPVAIDFDLASIVRDPINPAASERHLVEAGEDWLARWMAKQLRDFQETHGATAALQTAAEIRELLPRALAAIDALDVGQAAKIRARAHLEAFAAALAALH